MIVIRLDFRFTGFSLIFASFVILNFLFFTVNQRKIKNNQMVKMKDKTLQQFTKIITLNAYIFRII